MAQFWCSVCGEEIVPCSLPQQAFEEEGRFSRQPCKQPILCHGARAKQEAMMLGVDEMLQCLFAITRQDGLIRGCGYTVLEMPKKSMATFASGVRIGR